MREVEKCWGPGSLSEGLDAVLCEPMLLQASVSQRPGDTGRWSRAYRQ